MWNALKGDLMEFASTIKQDVSAALEEMNEIAAAPVTSARGSGGTDHGSYADEIAHSRATFAEDVHNHEFKAFKENFQLNEHASDIARLLGSYGSDCSASIGDGSSVGGAISSGGNSDDSAEINAFLTELVPAIMSKEEFWARYYFRVSKLSRNTSKETVSSAIHGSGGSNSNIGHEEDEEENIGWGEDDDADVSNTIINPTKPINTHNDTIQVNATNYKDLMEENTIMKKTICCLNEQISVLNEQLNRLQCTSTAPPTHTQNTHLTISPSPTIINEEDIVSTVSGSSSTTSLVNIPSPPKSETPPKAMPADTLDVRPSVPPSVSDGVIEDDDEVTWD